MKLAKPNSKEYWEAYQQYESEKSKSSEYEAIRIVNDISILEEDFAVKVLESIEEAGRIYVRTILKKRTQSN